MPGKSCPTFTRGEGKLCVGRTGIVSSPLCPEDMIGLKLKRRFSWKCSTLLLSKTNQAVGLRGQDFTLGDSRPARHQHTSSRPPPALWPPNGSILSQFTAKRSPPICWVRWILYSSLSRAFPTLCLEIMGRCGGERGAKREEKESEC